MLAEEMENFCVTDTGHRLLRGGLPSALPGADLEFYAESLDSCFARDVQELFRLAKRTEFLLFVELVLSQSGGLLEVTSLAKPTGVSRPTIMAWLEVLQVTHSAQVLRPYAEGGRWKIIGQPKRFGFDNGFACHARGWDSLRPEDLGILWKHLMLGTLVSIPLDKFFFRQDKQHREVDFVLPRGRGVVNAIECKGSVDAFERRNLAAFRSNYPEGRNQVMSPQERNRNEPDHSGLRVVFLPVSQMRREFSPLTA